MEVTISRMEERLRTWGLKIQGLASAVHGVGTRREFDALVYIDELKTLHAIARSQLDEFKATEHSGRDGLEAGLREAMDELDEAFENLRG